MRMKTLMLTAATAAVLALGSATAYATPSLTFSVEGWSASTPGATIGSASQQALPSNPLITGADLATTFSFTGLPEWSAATQSANTIGAFASSGGGTVSGQQYFNGFSGTSIQSTTNFASATIYELTFSTVNTITGSITHDDGLSIYNSALTSAVLNSSAPTVAIPTSFDLMAGTYHLFYLEANGAPADLQFNNVKVPEPGSLALLGTALIGLGLILRRRNRA